MAATSICPECGQANQFADSLAGCVVFCSKCHANVIVPTTYVRLIAAHQHSTRARIVSVPSRVPGVLAFLVATIACAIFTGCVMFGAFGYWSRLDTSLVWGSEVGSFIISIAAIWYDSDDVLPRLALGMNAIIVALIAEWLLVRLLLPFLYYGGLHSLS